MIGFNYVLSPLGDLVGICLLHLINYCHVVLYLPPDVSSEQYKYHKNIIIILYDQKKGKMNNSIIKEGRIDKTVTD